MATAAGGEDGPEDGLLDRGLRISFAGSARELGRWRLEAEIGAGATGRVFLARPRRDTAEVAAGTPVAVKVFHPHLIRGERFFKRFLREAEIGRLVRHENVVRILDCDAARRDGETLLFIVMEFVPGRTLRAVLDAGGRLPEAVCRIVGREAARGLAAIHAVGAIHRDLKPENLMITRDWLMKVMDLGVARFAREDVRLSTSGTFVGSIAYAAPEQFSAHCGNLDARADLYALGLVLFEAASGVHPFARRTFEEAVREPVALPPPLGRLRPDLSPAFIAAVGRLLAPDREARPARAADVVSLLDPAAAARPSGLSPEERDLLTAAMRSAGF